MSGARGLIRAVLFAGLCATAVAEVPGPQGIDTAPAGWVPGPFVLHDRHGQVFSARSLEGGWTFMLLGDADCGAPCDEALAALAGLGGRLARTAKRPAVVVVDLRPVAAAAALAPRVAAVDARFITVAGAPPELAALADELIPMLAPAAPRLAAGELDAYRGTLFLFGPEGALRAEFLPPFDAARLTERYLKLRLGR